MSRPAGTSARVPWLDTAKGLSLCFIVLFHVELLSLSSRFESSDLWDVLRWQEFTFRIPLFFAVSGFLCRGLSMPLRSYLDRRLLALVWLYLLWTAVYFLVQRRDPALLPSALYSPVLHLWYIWALFLYRFLAKLLLPVRLPALLVFLAISVAGYLGAYDALSYPQRCLLTHGVFFFLFCWYGDTLIGDVSRWPHRVLLIGLAGFLMVFPIGQLALHVLFGVMMGFGLAAVLTLHLPRLSGIIAYLGRHSLEIFILHFGLIGPLLKLMAPLPGSLFWGVPVVAALAIALSLGIRRVTDRLAPWLFALPPQLRLRPAPIAGRAS